MDKVVYSEDRGLADLPEDFDRDLAELLELEAILEYRRLSGPINE